MQGRGSRKRTLVWGLALLTSCASGAAGAAPGDRQPVDRVRLADPMAANALRSAITRATRRLATPSCRRVLSEFQDDTGQTLQSVLDRAGQSTSEHMAGLFFYDGSRTPQCQAPGRMAFTSRGSRVVLVCPVQLESQERRDAVQLDVLIIHETLHTLGLGENPPTSGDISARVFSRCVANVSPAN